VSVIFIKPRRVGEPGTDRGEFPLFLFCWPVAGRGPAMGARPAGRRAPPGGVAGWGPL